MKICSAESKYQGSQMCLVFRRNATNKQDCAQVTVV